MITIEMIDKGIKQGIIRIDDTSIFQRYSVRIGIPIPICRIGEYWFYFAGQEGEECLSSTNYLLDNKREDIVKKIYDALNDLKYESYDEYCYYEWILKESIKNDEQNTVM